jgi:hypothetical protein
LRQHRIGHAGAGVHADNQRRKIGRAVKIGLHEVAQVFQVAIGKYALGAVRFQHRIEFWKIDAHHHGALQRKLLRQGVGTRVPALIAGQEQYKAGRLSRRVIDRQVLEAPMAQVRRSGRREIGQERQHGHKKERFHRLVTLAAQNARE